MKYSNEETVLEKEQLISQLLQLNYYKSTDDRQLYELTLNELETEYKIVIEQHYSN
ncbi:MAG: Fur-regulated basic protein FbpA [Bacillus sp. (in: firmicutes)]